MASLIQCSVYCTSVVNPSSSLCAGRTGQAGHPSQLPGESGNKGDQADTISTATPDSTIQYSTVQYSTVQYGTAQHSTISVRGINYDTRPLCKKQHIRKWIQ